MAAQAGGGDCVCIGIRISVIVAVAVGVVHCAVGILKFELFCLFFQVGRQFSQYLGFGIRVFRMLFKGEDIFTVFFGLVYLAFQDVVEVGKKSGIYFAVRGGYLYIISFYLVQLVVVIEEPEYILPYGVAEQDFVIFLRSVGVDDEQDIEFVFADEECVMVEETVFELLIHRVAPTGGRESGDIVLKIVSPDIGADEKIWSDIVAFSLRVAIAGEGPGAFFVAGEFADEVRVFYLLIQVADKGASGHVAACYVGYALVFGLSGPLD